VYETSNFIQGYMCQSTGGVCRRQVILYRVTCVRVLGGVHETSNFTQVYMRQSTGGLCRRKINFIQGYMCQSTGVVFRRKITLYRVSCVRVLGEYA